jgi:hypothetical protein
MDRIDAVLGKADGVRVMYANLTAIQSKIESEMDATEDPKWILNKTVLRCLIAKGYITEAEITEDLERQRYGQDPAERVLLLLGELKSNG